MQVRLRVVLHVDLSESETPNIIESKRRLIYRVTQQLQRLVPSAAVRVLVSSWEEEFVLMPPRPSLERLLQDTIARALDARSEWLVPFEGRAAFADDEDDDVPGAAVEASDGD